MRDIAKENLNPRLELKTGIASAMSIDVKDYFDFTI
jgi:hypothetical protein